MLPNHNVAAPMARLAPAASGAERRHQGSILGTSCSGSGAEDSFSDTGGSELRSYVFDALAVHAEISVAEARRGPHVNERLVRREVELDVVHVTDQLAGELRIEIV